MKYKPSKKLKPGMLCMRHGQWLVPARGKVAKIVGVWRGGEDYWIIAPDGTPHRVRHNAGLVIQGTCVAMAANK